MSSKDSFRPRILGLCGSLRAESSNLRALLNLQKVAANRARFDLFTHLDHLPAFNPDLQDSLDAERHPELLAWIDQVRHCEALVVSSPVYANGYPGALKNALDWLVGTDAFVAKPFALLNTSSRSIGIQDTLISVLETMSGMHVQKATTTLATPSPTTSTEPEQIEGLITKLLEHLKRDTL